MLYFCIASADPHTIISGGIYTNTPDTAVVLGIQGADNVTTSVADLLPQTDIKKRTAKNQWWLGLNQLVRTLARHGFALGRPLAEGIDGK